MENIKCVVGLKRNGGWVIPYNADGETEAVQCDQPVVAEEPYGPFDYQVLPVCAEHREVIRMLYRDVMGWEI